MKKGYVYLIVDTTHICVGEIVVCQLNTLINVEKWWCEYGEDAFCICGIDEVVEIGEL